MRIAIIGSKNYDSLEYNLDESFNYNGYECKIFDIYDHWFYKYPFKKITQHLDVLGRHYFDGYDEDVFNRLYGRVIDYNPNLVIGIYRFIHPSFVREIKNKHIKIVHINPDQLTTLDLQQLFVEPYDVYFTKDPYMARFMGDNMKLNVKLYCEAFNKRIHLKPDVDKKSLEEKYNIDVLAFGNLYPYRNRMLLYLKEKGVSLSLYGSKCRFFLPELDPLFHNKVITGKEKTEILYGAKIVFNNLHYAEIESVNNKFFEINGSGAFQLCDYRPILHELLPIDPNLVSYRNIDEAVEKIVFYLRNPQKRYAIAEQIYTHFQNKFNYDILIKHILSNI